MFQRHHNASSTASAGSTSSVQQLLISLLLLLSFSLSPFAQATAPVVSVTAPATNSKSIAPASITITATATNDATATISKVQFYRGTTLLGTSTTAPYSYTWTNVAAGSYNLTAKATNSLNQVTTSAIVAVVVNNLPTVSLTAPANNSSVAGKATVNLTATASDTGGSIAKVEFFNGSTLLGSDTTSPYSYSWTNVVPGTYSITAKATDNLGDTKTTSVTTLTVTNPLSTSLTAPTNNSIATAGSAITVSANAATSKSGTTISKVEFYQGSTLIGSDTSSPYSISWTGAAIGTYSLTAKVTDSQGLTQTSSPISIQVKGNAPTVSLLTPANNASYTAPATISLTSNASANGSGNSITKVEYFQGTTLIGTATNSPYTASWTNAPAGTYSLTAKATDAQGLTQTSTAITVKVNGAPAVSITSPASNAKFLAPATISLTSNASATGSGVSITKVEYYQGTTLIGTATSAPYTASWANVAIGNYSITAKATDSNGLTQTSAPIAVQVNSLPTISLATPVANANFIAPASVTLTSTPATVGSGVTISKVEYFQGSTLVATAAATTAPYSASWTNAPAGSYSLTAKVTDSNGNSATSTPVAITIINNTAPTVSLTANPSSGTAPATIILNATASDTDGSIAKVELLNGSTVLKTFTAPQATYNYLWENVPQGSYNLTAKATDNLGASTTTSVVPVSVTASVAKIYDIHADHLGTPRMVTDASGNSVWEWIGTPFGESLPNQNPNNTGAQNDFVMNLRFPGQVFDKETGLHYNYFRDYDPSTGRYVQSDPIGLGGGINTFGYVEGNPISFTDPTGEAIPIIAGGIWAYRAYSAYRVIKAAKLARDLAIAAAAAKALSQICQNNGNGDNGGNGPKIPPNLQPNTNPPQGPVIPEGWESRPGRNGGEVYFPPGSDPADGEHIRVMPPGSTPVPGLQDGYWIWVNGNKQPIDPSTGKPGGRGQTHIPLPPDSVPPTRRPPECGCNK